MSNKDSVLKFWSESPCGEDVLLPSLDKVGYVIQSEEKYRLEPFIVEFAQFSKYSEKKVLEIGVGLGTDHQKFAESGALLSGIDLTKEAVNHVQRRFGFFGLESNVRVGDAERLEFSDGTFDLVYSWGVIHHSPDTPKVISEILRVLKPGGQAKIMIYNKWSIVGFMLWLRYGLLALRPHRNLSDIYSQHIESPGTKAYDLKEGYELFSQFSSVKITTVLTHADLLTSGAGQRHEGWLLVLARKIWPSMIIKILFKRAGLFMLIDAVK